MRWRLAAGPFALAACVGAASARSAEPLPGAPAAACAAPAPAPAPASDPASRALERGNELMARGDAAGALAAYAESRALAEAGGAAPLAALASANAARAALEAGELDRAERELERAVAEADAIPDARARARLLVHAGRTEALLAAQRPASGATARRAAELLSRAAKTAAAAGDARDESYALGWLGGLYERGGRPEDALELTRRALAAGLRADAPDALYRWQWQAGRIERARGRADLALTHYRQAAATLGRLREEALTSGSGPGAAPEGAGELQLELVDLLLARVGASPDAAERQALLREALDALESQKVQELRDYFRDECLAAQRQAAPEELPGVLVVYPVVLPDRLELIVGGSGGLERRIVQVDRETFTAEVRALRRLLARRTTRQYLRHAQRLYDWVIRPLAPELASRRPGTLVFVPGGALRTIPFAALHDRERGEFLIEQLPVAVLPSLALTDPRPLPRERVRLLAAGISEPVLGYPALERVADEIEAVHAIFPGRTLLDGDFLVSRFVRLVEERPFGIVHVASHAEFSDDPDGSFLLAFDGKISLERLASVVGTTRFRSEQPLELLALSACETAAGNDRAALGLAGIALRSGARSALATLWPVNDEAAAKLVSAFYRELGRPELSRAQALQAAQLGLLRTREWSHPALWSPFVLISSWL
jgi:CHAT domain-containing protein